MVENLTKRPLNGMEIKNIGKICRWAGDKLENARYAKMIDHELERSTHMLLIISNPADIKTGWVEYVWFTFHYEMMSGRKKEGSLYIIALNKPISNEQLPIRLRDIQQTVFNPQNISIEELIGVKQKIFSN